MTMHYIAVIGAGTMGSGIAQVCASAEHLLLLIDINQQALDKGLETIRQHLDRQVAKGVLSQDQASVTLQRIRTSTCYADLDAVDLVIEAATENLALKRSILQQVAAHVRPDCLIASNTSSLSITELAAGISHPERFMGIHFFNPVPVMGLVELIPGLLTSEATAASARALVERLGKTAIFTGNRPGFMVNRILMPMINEAIFVLQENGDAQAIDTSMRLGCNQPIGPLALADLIGLDTVLAILDTLQSGFGDPKYRAAPLLRELVAAGLLGKKTGRGFHAYR
ncbi:3-hydroxyacyl-CoA dehydrogenase NAD-binding domain-containing protein [Pseudomonas sp. P97.38]|uniref:3-hydroxyacyl-CoA dehydrogenase NAD-binding domain-containing protein n=1 Tax=Pseudomonas sp. P97.38 TaxID=255451 RepID=UPI00069CDFBC|nr:3-hydroxyacyl-CoA dehydrogenase NAD-binding domain-containing protein [Pseudomonas sp. P97.38]